jgi:melibiose permease
MAVYALGKGNEVAGFRLVALLIGIIFVLFIGMTCFSIKEKSTVDMPTSTIKDMLKSLFNNDQALIIVLTIVLVNVSVYITSNLVIYFFKYDFGGEGWRNSYTLFSTVGGAFQILGMMVLYPILRKKGIPNEKVFKIAIAMAITGYGCLLLILIFGFTHNLIAICVPGILVFAANGVLSVLTTVFLSGSVDYGEMKTGRREESVIFSMQTFVVKAASGVAVFLTGIGLDIIGLVGNTDDEATAAVQSASTLMGLRLLMTVLPMLGLIIAIFLFKNKFKLTDAYQQEIHDKLRGPQNEA